jgi:hypothetical protein
VDGNSSVTEQPSESLAGLTLKKEKETIRTILKTIEQSTGRRPQGWLGSGLAETHNTLW